LGHCAGVLRWFLGSWAIFLCRGSIWGTVQGVRGGFWEVKQISYVGGRFGARCRRFEVVFGDLGNVPLMGSIWGTVQTV
jgi:hypothetical protein